jgi:uncharacterized protein YPO0396
VLGWSNTAKIATLEAQARQLENNWAKPAQKIAQLQVEAINWPARLDALAKLDVFTIFTEIDWSTAATEIARSAGRKTAAGIGLQICSSAN